MDQKLFRKEALNQLSSPAQLDKLMSVTSLKSWLILLAVGIIIISALIWGITGTLFTRVDADGVLVNEGGVVTIPALSSGCVLDIRIKTGDIIAKGDIIARIEQKELVDSINLFIQKINKAKEGKQDISQLEMDLANQQKKLKNDSYIIAQDEGRITEVHIKRGEYVTQGSSVAVVSKEGQSIKNLVAVLYVPLEYGKQLSEGMETNIYPSIVKKEEFGYMLGRVLSVSEYPATEKNIFSLVGSQGMAANFLSGGAVLEVIVDLLPSKDTPSGFKWSTLAGPPLKIESGTICKGSIIVQKVRPIEMLLPSIKKLIRG